MEYKANILVAELLDTELIGERAIQSYNHAHQNLMEADCICVPDSASIYIDIVDSQTANTWNKPKSHLIVPGSDQYIKIPSNVLQCPGLSSIQDVQLSQFPLDEFSTICGPIKVCEIDFSGKSVIPKDEQQIKEFRAERRGLATTIFFWWNLKMEPTGSITLSCAPHWRHPARLKQIANEADSQNGIPWRDHWMQGIYHLTPHAFLRSEEHGFIAINRDEFSWWFKIGLHNSDVLDNEKLSCSCIFHIKNSRNRIMQMSNKERTMQFVEALKKSNATQSVILGIGDHNMVALAIAAAYPTAYVFILEKDPMTLKSMNNFAECNSQLKLLRVVHCEGQVPLVKVEIIVGEPHFSSAILPYNNIPQFWAAIKKFRHNKKIIPSDATVYAIPVHFLNLHKIRWPLKSTCGGFDHEIFDIAISEASEFSDASVEPFSLWEYPAIALGASNSVFNMNFSTGNVNSEVTIKIDNFEHICNGIAFWVNWNLTDDNFVSGGPSQFDVGELLKWPLHERQGVHLIPYKDIEKGTISNIKICCEMTEESLNFKFIYQYED